MILPKQDFLFTAVFRRRETGDDLVDWTTKDDDYVMWAYVAHKGALTSGAHGQELRDLIAPRITTWHRPCNASSPKPPPTPSNSSTSPLQHA